MSNKIDIEEFIELVSSSISDSNKKCSSKEYTFLIKDMKIEIPCILEYKQDSNRINVSCLDKKLIQSKSYDPSTVARIHISGDNFTGLANIDNEEVK